MIAFQQEEVPKLNRHIFSVDTTSATKVIDAVVPAASIPGMFPIRYLKKTGPQLWESGGEEQSFHHVDESRSPHPNETIFDDAKFAEAKTEAKTSKPADEKLSDKDFVNKETLCFITRNEKQSEAKITHIPHDEPGKLLYAFSSAPIGDEHNVTWISSLTRDRTVFIDNSDVSSVKYGTRGEKKKLFAAGERAMRDYAINFMPPILEASKSKSSFFRRRKSGASEASESPQSERQKCLIM